MTRTLLVLWMALIGAVRLDLAGGALPVTLSPFLVLTPLLVGALALRRFRRAQPVVIEWASLGYLLFVSLFFAAAGASTFLSLDADATLARSALLILQFGGATAIALLVHDDTEAINALRSGAVLGVALFVVMDVLAVLSFAGVLPKELSLGGPTLRLDSYGYAGIIPRLSGTVLDPNNAGLVLLIYAFLAPRVRGTALVLMLLTLSRSAVLAALTLGVVAAWQSGILHRAAPVKRLLLAITVAAVGLTLVARSPGAIEGTAKMMAPFAERFGGGEEENSAADHRALIVRAADEGSRTIPRALLGLGWGASYVVLQDLFPGNRYGNFHSLYGTAFAEAGVVALVSLLALLLVPLGRHTPWRPAVAGFIVFNLFYQSTTEPVFWLVLALAWLAKSARPAPEVTFA